MTIKIETEQDFGKRCILTVHDTKGATNFGLDNFAISHNDQPFLISVHCEEILGESKFWPLWLSLDLSKLVFYT